MICDAHIHVGYYNRKGCAEPFYYSPRRICTVLKKCGVDEFIYSSTSMQTVGIVYQDVDREMLEVQRLFGKGAHPFLWVTKNYLDAVPNVFDLDFGFYEGVKLHGMDGSHWITENCDAIEDVLSAAERCDMPVMIHTGCDEESRPINYLPYILNHPQIRFNLAHGRPVDEAETCLKAAMNVFVDISCMSTDAVMRLVGNGWTDRLLWGTDTPAMAALGGESLTRTMCRNIQAYSRLEEECHIDFARNFKRYLVGVGCGEMKDAQ